LSLWDHIGLPATHCNRGDSHAFTPSVLPVFICRPRKDEWRVDLGGWLYRDGLPVDGHPSKY